MRSQAPAIIGYWVEPASPYRRLLKWFRVTAFVILLGLGYFAAVIPRSWTAGFAAHLTLLVTATFIGPTALVAFLGLPWRRHLAVVVLLIVVPTVIGEVQATLEEQLFLATVKKLPLGSPAISKPQRWWPNQTSYLLYDPATGVLHAGD